MQGPVNSRDGVQTYKANDLKTLLHKFGLRITQVLLFLRKNLWFGQRKDIDLKPQLHMLLE